MRYFNSWVYFCKEKYKKRKERQQKSGKKKRHQDQTTGTRQGSYNPSGRAESPRSDRAISPSITEIFFMVVEFL